jgi:hypothetical protein
MDDAKPVAFARCERLVSGKLFCKSTDSNG